MRGRGHTHRGHKPWRGPLHLPDGLLQKLIAGGQIATQYVGPGGEPSMDLMYDPNGSVLAIEGITSPDAACWARWGIRSAAARASTPTCPGISTSPSLRAASSISSDLTENRTEPAGLMPGGLRLSVYGAVFARGHAVVVAEGAGEDAGGVEAALGGNVRYALARLVAQQRRGLGGRDTFMRYCLGVMPSRRLKVRWHSRSPTRPPRLCPRG